MDLPIHGEQDFYSIIIIASKITIVKFIYPIVAVQVAHSVVATLYCRAATPACEAKLHRSIHLNKVDIE